MSKFGQLKVGEVFLSHSSPDKPFVRRLDKSLRADGWQTWLDEHSLVAGDSLPGVISTALARAKIIIVVISEHSHSSNWVKFELRHAVARMIKGECRVIPVLRGAVEMPAEFSDLLYVDYRPGSRNGLVKIKTALMSEARKHIEPPSMAETESIPRKHAVDALVRKVFDSMGFVSGEISAARSLDYEFVGMTSRSRSSEETNEHEFAYSHIWLRGYKDAPLGQHDWYDWTETVETDYNLVASIMVVSDRSIDNGLVGKLRQLEPYLWIAPEPPHGRSLHVLLDLTGVVEDDEAMQRLRTTYRHVKRLAEDFDESDWGS